MKLLTQQWYLNGLLQYKNQHHYQLNKFRGLINFSSLFFYLKTESGEDMDLKHKILYGFDEVYICKNDSVPMKLEGALEVNIKLDRESIYIKDRGNKIRRIDTSIEGSGTLTLLSLTLEEKSLILGHGIVNNGLVGGINTPPNLALMFSREKANGFKLYHIFYNVQFKEETLTAKTYNGNFEEDILSIDFDVFKDKDKNLVYYVIDTETTNSEIIANWFTKITYPSGVI